MTAFLALCSALVFCAPACADPKLVGRWRSDRELTMAHVRSHSKMEEKTILFIEQMVGRATLTFDSRSLKTDMPAFQSRTVEGVVSELAAVVETHPYKLLGSSGTQVAVMSTEPGSGRKRHIVLYTFEEPDRMWVYWGGGLYFDPHVREYFVRDK